MGTQIALGLKAHSGWAALVALGVAHGALAVVDRRRLELVEPADVEWAKQPYHAAHGLDPESARDVVERAIAGARRAASRELRAAQERARRAGQEIVGCAVLRPEPMPAWGLAEILSVHPRMHKAEGVLFPDALAHAASACGLALVAVPEKRLAALAEERLAASQPELAERVAALGRAVGPPWGKDQKCAALAAWIALRERGAPRSAVARC
jgi:hypothetical protein